MVGTDVCTGPSAGQRFVHALASTRQEHGRPIPGRETENQTGPGAGMMFGLVNSCQNNRYPQNRITITHNSEYVVLCYVTYFILYIL